MSTRKVFDCFLFYNELDVLDLRLAVLDDHVDYFVLVESNKTFMDNPKEFVFEQNKDRYKKYLDKIVHVKVEDSPPKKDVWNIEWFQRDCITRGLDKAKKGDLIIISDVDEIPNPRIIDEWGDYEGMSTLKQHLFYYYVNCLSDFHLWNGSVIAPYGYEGATPQELRDMGRRGVCIVWDGGWHYSYLGGLDAVKDKFKNLSDSHYVIDDVGTEKDMEEKYSQLKSMWSDEQYRLVDVKDFGPPQIQEFIRSHPQCFLS